MDFSDSLTLAGSRPNRRGAELKPTSISLHFRGLTMNMRSQQRGHQATHLAVSECDFEVKLEWVNGLHSLRLTSNLNTLWNCKYNWQEQATPWPTTSPHLYHESTSNQPTHSY